MAIDNTKAIFSSLWEIDQLIATDSLAVAAGEITIYTITGTPTLPIFEVQFKPTGSSKWFISGVGSTNATLAGLFTFYTYISGSSLKVHAPSAGTVRYFIWSDRVDN